MLFKDKIKLVGNLSIYKLEDNKEELLYQENNIIVSGLGAGITRVFVDDGSSEKADYTMGYFQVGVSGDDALLVDSTTELVSPLELKEYGTSSISIQELNLIDNKLLKYKQAFVKIFPSNIKPLNLSSTEFRLVLDNNVANNVLRNNTLLPLNEIGLFMKNPFWINEDGKDNPLLSAYRTFDPIIKTGSYTLIFRWVIRKS